MINYSYDKYWYDNLNKSSLTPPNYVFSIVWPLLYTLLAISFIFTYTSKKCKGICKPLKFFILQLILNLMWTTIFFKFKYIVTAFLMILVIIIITYYTFMLMIPISKLSAYLLIPYLLWLCFASYLNFYIIFNNMA